MTQIENWLSGGDLRSDGASNEVAQFVIQYPAALDDLVGALYSDDEVIRGRAADALEKVARVLPDQVVQHFNELLGALAADQPAMARWHLAMSLGHLSIFKDQRGEIFDALAALLRDESAFVISWAIASLCIIAALEPAEGEQIANLIAPFLRSDSVALRSRARKALKSLTDVSAPIPEGWIKSDHVRARINR